MIGQVAIIVPVIVLVAVIYVVFFIMFVQRGRLMKAKPPRKEDFATSTAAMAYFEPAEMPANNLRNLYEMPVLFFAIVPLLLITHNANHIQIILAWVYVLLRAVHSFIHLAKAAVWLRFMAYAASCAVLLAMWIGLAVDLLTAG